MTDTALPEVWVRQQGRLGRLTLNRPLALNALTLAMVRAMQAAIDGWAADPSVTVVAIEGAGERGLCAGGDIRAIHASIVAGDGMAQDFWREEYRLNATIAKYPKPYVALMDGLVMGGGVGISAHGSHRLATERTRLAMPEAGIGFFPDVGGSWLLAHAPGETGVYLGMTGTQINAADTIAAGLANHAIRHPDWQALLTGLQAASSRADVDALVRKFSTAPGERQFAAHQAEIDELFAFERVKDILIALQRKQTDFAAQTLKQIEAKSPMSLMVTLAAIRHAKGLATLDDALAMELRLGQWMSSRHDFTEGIRAAVIDKDQRPRWQPSALGEIDETEVARHVEGPA